MSDRPDKHRLLQALAWVAPADAHHAAEKDPTGIGVRLMMQPSVGENIPETELQWLADWALAFRLTPPHSDAYLVITKDLMWHIDWLVLMYGIEQEWSDSLLAGVLAAKLTFEQALALSRSDAQTASLETLGALRNNRP